MEPTAACYVGRISRPKTVLKEPARQDKRLLELLSGIFYAEKIFDVLNNDPKRDPVVLTKVQQPFENFAPVHRCRLTPIAFGR
jgi:hypothetical protein